MTDYNKKSADKQAESEYAYFRSPNNPLYVTTEYAALNFLSKRDSIALSALNGMVNNDDLIAQVVKEFPFAINSDKWPEFLVKASFELADEFLKQSQKPVDQ